MSCKIVVFPHAGGNANSYLQWKRFLKYPVYPIEYSGHWTRFDEPQYFCFEELLADIVAIITKVVSAKDTLYLVGHSMGGLVAFAVDYKIQMQKFCRVGALFISSCVPMENDVWKTFKAVTDEDVKMFLYRIHHNSEKVLNSSFFHENLLPSIKNDFRIITEMRNCDILKKNCSDAPIICLSGKKDPIIPDTKALKEWEAFTSKSVKYFEFEGDHFYLNNLKNREKICLIINETIMFGT
ncbi:alpha/beta fold hydrolase [Lachnospiraceae bacterium 47-T17]